MKNHKPLKILLIEDDEDDFVLTRNLLDDIDQFNFELDWESSASDAKRRIIEDSYDICFVDYRLGTSDGIDLIKMATKADVPAPVILLTGKGNRAVDQQAMDLGAADFLVKSELRPETIERSIRYALKNRKALNLVKQGEKKFRQLFERSIDSIFLTDTDYKLIDVNPSFGTLFHRQDILSENLSFFFEETTSFFEFDRRLKNEGQVRDFEANMRFQNSKTVNCLITCVERTNYHGESIGYQGIIRDITLQKKAEVDLIMAEKLSMTGKLARSIAHEVRNPLTNLSLALGQLEEELTSDNEDVRMFLEIINRNSARIDQLITEMLNSSKPKALDKNSYDINILINETTILIQDRLTLKDMELEIDLNPVPKPLMIDSDNLKMALLNIMVNAIEAMEEGKGCLKINNRVDKDYIHIYIKDNGSGISEEELNSLFDAFYTNKPGGTGLGLTTTQNIINSHGGRIQVNSEKGSGTLFKVSIPFD